MKKTRIICVALACITLLLAFAACTKTEWVLNEGNFFFTMDNVLRFPGRYYNNTFDLNCFTYQLTDVNGKTYMCGVRHSSSEYGCTCGNDKIVGFVLDYDGEIPTPINQSDKYSVEKAWIHVRGKITSEEYVKISVWAFTDGQPDQSKPVETIALPLLTVESLTVLTEEEYKNLQQYGVKDN